MRTLSSTALAAIFGPESQDDLIVLMTITGTGISSPIRLANGFTGRLSETAEEVVYGVESRGDDYIFLPITASLPSDENEQPPRAQLSIADVTRYLTPVIRSITSAPSVKLELVLRSDPDTVEIEFPGLLMAGINYNKDLVTAELTVESLTLEPFPAHTFTPSGFPGMF